MPKSEVKDVVAEAKRIIGFHLGVEESDVGVASFENLPLDRGVYLRELITDLESEFGVVISNTDMKDIKTIGELARHLKSKTTTGEVA